MKRYRWNLFLSWGTGPLLVGLLTCCVTVPNIWTFGMVIFGAMLMVVGTAVSVKEGKR